MRISRIRHPKPTPPTPGSTYFSRLRPRMHRNTLHGSCCAKAQCQASDSARGGPLATGARRQRIMAAMRPCACSGSACRSVRGDRGVVGAIWPDPVTCPCLWCSRRSRFRLPACCRPLARMVLALLAWGCCSAQPGQRRARCGPPSPPGGCASSNCSGLLRSQWRIAMVSFVLAWCDCCLVANVYFYARTPAAYSDSTPSCALCTLFWFSMHVYWCRAGAHRRPRLFDVYRRAGLMRSAIDLTLVVLLEIMILAPWPWVRDGLAWSPGVSAMIRRTLPRDPPTPWHLVEEVVRELRL